MNGVGAVEIVVEAVLDRRADGRLGIGKEVLHGVGEHVSGRMAQLGQSEGRRVVTLGVRFVSGAASALRGSEAFGEPAWMPLRRCLTCRLIGLRLN